MTIRPRRLALLAPLLAVSLLAGCGDDPSPAIPTAEVTQTDADDLASQVGGALAADGGGTLAVIESIGTAYSTDKDAPADTTVALNGLTWSLTRTFYNAAGAVVAGYNPLTTVRVVVATRASGSLGTPYWNASVGRSAGLDASGIAAAQDTLRLSGAADDTVQCSFTSLDGTRTRHFHLRTAAALTGLVYAKPVAAGTWPLRGTATYAVVADRLRSSDVADVEVRFTATITVRFNGTQYATVEVDHQWSYRMDLATGEVVRLTA